MIIRKSPVKIKKSVKISRNLLKSKQKGQTLKRHRNYKKINKRKYKIKHLT